MNRSKGFDRFKVALLAVGSAALLLSSCGRQAEEEETKHEQLMTEYCEEMDLKVSENGHRSFHFQAPLLEGYTEAQEPYREFRRGIKITTYQKDSANVVDAVLTADYAINYDKRQLWEARGNVVIVKNDPDSTRIYTQQIFWDQRSGKVYSNVDSRIVRKMGADDFMVSGFETDEEFSFLNSREPDGKMEVDVSKLPRTPADSVAPAEADGADARPAGQSTRQPASAGRTEPATTRRTAPAARQRIKQPDRAAEPPRQMQGDKFKALKTKDRQVPVQEEIHMPEGVAGAGPAERKGPTEHTEK